MADAVKKLTDFDSAFEDAFRDFSVAGEGEPAAKLVEEEPVQLLNNEGEVEATDEEIEAEANDETEEADEEEPTLESDADPDEDEVEVKPALKKSPETTTKEVTSEPKTELSEEDILNRLASAIKDKDEPEKKADKEVKAEEVPRYNDEEKALLDQYREDWPDVHKAESLIRRGEYQEIVQYVFSEIAQQLQPMMEQVQAIAETMHYSDLQSRIGDDYDNVREEVGEWVNTQPAYLQAAYQHVMSNGTADEVADLVERYRQATGQVKSAPAVEKKEHELPPATKKAVKSLAPVSSKRSSVPKADDPDDFESAFTKFADEMKS